MKVKVFGVGAAGNKAAIKVIEDGVLSSDDVVLFNTTLQDIPEGYKEIGYSFNRGSEGTGKERSEGKKAMIEAIQTKKFDITSMLNEDTDLVVIATSTEGGSGSGATIILVKYFISLNVPVHVFAFTGFDDDVRGLKNTLEFFKDLEDNVTLHVIKNVEFLDYTENHSTAEDLANEEFARQIEVIAGNYMIPAKQNMDHKDSYKLLTQTGYMDIQRIDIGKNKDVTNQSITDAYENLKGFEFDRGAKRLGIIINATESRLNNIDQSFEIVERYVGIPFEIYRHIQNDGSNNEYMYIIASGLAFPSKDIQRIAKLYKDLDSQVNRNTSSFKDIFNDIDLGDDDFDVNQNKFNDKSTADKLFSQMINDTVPTASTANNKNNNKKFKATGINNVVEVDDEDNEY